MRDSLFKSTQAMPPKNSSADVVRVAQTKVEMHENYVPALAFPNKDMSTVSADRPLRGCHY